MRLNSNHKYAILISKVCIVCFAHISLLICGPNLLRYLNVCSYNQLASILLNHSRLPLTAGLCHRPVAQPGHHLATRAPPHARSILGDRHDCLDPVGWQLARLLRSALSHRKHSFGNRCFLPSTVCADILTLTEARFWAW